MGANFSSRRERQGMDPASAGLVDFAFASRAGICTSTIPRLVRLNSAHFGLSLRGCIQKGARRPHMLVVFKGVSQGGKSKSPLGSIFGDFLCDQKVT